MKAIKKPIVIEFLQYLHNNNRDMFDFLTGTKNENMTLSAETFEIDYNKNPHGLIIKTLEGEMFANFNDYIIKGVNGEFYPCKPDIFKKTYDIIEE